MTPRLVCLCLVLGCTTPRTEALGPGIDAASGVEAGPVAGGSLDAASGAGAAPTTGVPPDAAVPSGAGPAAMDGPAAPVDAARATSDVAEPAPPTSLTINGTAVPREKAIVILHLGEANMAGRATVPAELAPYFDDTDPHLWRYLKGGVWAPAHEPLSGDGGLPSSPQGAGPGMALLRSALALAPDAYVVSIGRGQSSDFGGSCFSFRKGTPSYEAILEPARELKGRATFAGLFVMLSYSARTDMKALNGGFAGCLTGLVQEVRADLGEPGLPLVLGDYERTATATWDPTCCGAPQVIMQIAQVPTLVPRVTIVPTNGLTMQDTHHLNLAGQKEWASRALKGLVDAGLAPWAH
jgi:hypothetical protein